MTRFPNDPAAAASFGHRLVDGLAHQFNRANGLLDRLDAAIAAGEQAASESLVVRHLASDARVLRAVAEALDERCEALTGRAPRLRLVAAE
jgi:hypothetical protein